MLSFCRAHNRLPDYEPLFDRVGDEELANLALTLCHMVDRMMTSHLKKKEADFVENGGIKERMIAERLGRRRTQNEEIAALRAEATALQAENTALQAELAALRERLGLPQAGRSSPPSASSGPSSPSGRYYGYLFTPEGGEEFEFAGDSFREMLSVVVPQLGKAVWQMLDELPPDAVTIEFDPDWPVEPKGEETEG